LPSSFLPEFKGDAVKFEDFFCRVVTEVSPPLICCSRVSEQSAMLYPANPGNRVSTMPIKLGRTFSRAVNAQIPIGINAFGQTR
jgi:hypothetical protein